MLDFDLSVFIGAAVQGVPLVFVVIGLVWWYGKAFGIDGRAQFVSSMATGVVLGVPYMVSQAVVPVGDLYAQFVYWFAAIVYSLGLGVLSSLVYEFGKDTLQKVIGKLLNGGSL